MFVLFLFLVSCWGYNEGAWEVNYLEGTTCATADLQIATKLTQLCIKVETEGKTMSYMYKCTKSPWYNVSVEVFSNTNCLGTPIQNTHIATTEQCVKGGPDFDEVAYEWMCWEDYAVGFSNIEFDIPLHMDKSDVGSEDNPIVGTTYHPMMKCYHNKDLKKHVTVSCDETSGDGQIKVYETGLCLIPIHTIEMKKGEVVDFSKLSEEKAYLKYKGCDMK